MIGLQPVHDSPFDLAVRRLVERLAPEPAPAPEGGRPDWGRYRHDPVAWVQARLGEFLWSKQRAIAESVRDHRRTAVHSCYESGKSWIAARMAAWWIDTHPPGEAFVVSSAPTDPQVKAILWRELGRAHAKGRLLGRLNLKEWWVRLEDREELVAFGRKPKDMDPAAFQGIHARYVLVILDEAAGIADALWEAADSLIANEDSRILAIGNPDDTLGEFRKACSPGSGSHVIPISAFETPNFTDEPVPETLRPLLIGRTWVEEKRRKWTETSPLWTARVLGQFPEINVDGLIPMAWVLAAQQRTLEPAGPDELGVDVGAGGARSVIAHRRGPVVRIIHRDQNPDTMQTCGEVLAALKVTGAVRAKVDHVGIGRGVVDRARELDQPVVGINVGEPARDPEAFANLRAELWWGVRERFQAGDVDLDADDDELARQLVAIKYKRTSRGQIQIESKEDMRRRGLPSPDDADAVMLSLAPVADRDASALLASASVPAQPGVF